MTQKRKPPAAQRPPAEAAPASPPAGTEPAALAAPGESAHRALRTVSFPAVVGLAGGDPPRHGYLLQGESFQSLPASRQVQMLDDLEVYRRELPRLLREDEAGRFALVRHGEVHSTWDTAGDALQAARLFLAPEQLSVYEVRASDLRRFGLSGEESRAAPCQP